MSEEMLFREWARPGRRPAMDAGEPGLDESLDALCGWFKIFQLKKGHRFSTDDLLTAWYGTSWCPSAETILDLGSGIGTVAMVAAWRLNGATVVTVEAQEESVALARKSVLINGLSKRFDIRCGDFRDDAILRTEEKFDLVLGSPPYFPVESGPVGDHPQKVACRFELRGDISDYCKVAAAHLAPGGVFSCVFPVHPLFQQERLRNAAKNAGLTIVRHRPVILREGDAPLLGLSVMMLSSDLPGDFRAQTWIEPPLIIRAADGRIHPEYSAVKLSFGFPPQ